MEDKIEQAFLDNIVAHQAIIFKICRVYKQDAADREDLSQEIIYNAWRSYGRFENRSKFSTWLYRVALNTALYDKRRDKISSKLVDLELAENVHTIEPDDQSELLYAAISHLNSAFVLECVIAVFIYLLFFTGVYFFRSAIYSFLYKMVAVISIMSIPIFFRLYQSMQWMDQIDYSSAIGQNISSFLHHLKSTLRIYQFISVASLIIILIIFLTDSSFLALDLWIRAIVIVYLLLFGILTKPYLNWLYWKKVKPFQDFLDADI